MAPFLCARCGAPLELPRDAAVDVSCSFCKTRTPVPLEHLEALRRGAQIATFQGGPTPVAARRGTMSVVVAVGVVLIGVVVGMLTVGRRDAPVPVSVSVGPSPLPPEPPRPVVAPKPKAPEIATEISSFGGKGVGAGLYTDARTLAVDPDGNAFVGEYSSGRVQKFDSAGKFAQLITVPPKEGGSNHIFGLATDYAGNLYVSRSHEILKLSAKDGAVLATFVEHKRAVAAKASPDEMCADTLAIDPSNDLYVMSNCTPEGLSMNIESPYSVVKLDGKGKQLAHWKDPGADHAHIAVDGLGAIYVSNWMESGVYLYDATGKYSNKWGQSGNDPSDFTGRPGPIVVDPQGRVLVSDSRSIQVFEKTGKYRGRFGQGSARAMVVSQTGEIYVLAGDRPVVKYKLTL